MAVDAVALALVGVGGTLAGALVQWLLSAATATQDRRERQMSAWAEAVLAVLDAGGAANRWRLTATRDEQARLALEVALNRSIDRVVLACPLELTHPVTKYGWQAFAMLRGEDIDEGEFGGSEEELVLVFRTVSGVNKSLPWYQRGRRARRELAPEYR